jgi:hypothetical protein
LLTNLRPVQACEGAIEVARTVAEARTTRPSLDMDEEIIWRCLSFMSK